MVAVVLRGTLAAGLMAVLLCMFRLEDGVQRTTIMLPLELKMRAQQLAKRDGMSLGDLIRRALDAWLKDSQASSARLGKDSLFADDAVWSGDVPADLSQDHDRYLYGDGN